MQLMNYIFDWLDEYNRKEFIRTNLKYKKKLEELRRYYATSNRCIHKYDNK